MALTRRSVNRVSASIWPGFVDAMTALLLVLMFVLTIFMVVQFVLRETISGQEDELNELASEVSILAQALGLEQQRAANLEEEGARLSNTLAQAEATAESQAALIATLTGQINAAEDELEARASRITAFEAQVASLLSERDAAVSRGDTLAASVEELEAARSELISEQEALTLALATARTEIDAQAEAARLAAARREALEALTADLTARAESAEAALTAEEEARLAEAAAAEALRERLANSDAELTAMTLALEEERRRAEETLTLLAAAQAASDDLNDQLAAAIAARQAAETAATGAIETEAALTAANARIATLEAELRVFEGRAIDADALRAQLASALAAQAAAETAAEEGLSAAEERAALLAAANTALEAEEARSAESLREVAVLNQQVAALRAQLGDLQGLLDAANEADAASQVRIQTLGSDLNTALARAAAEAQRRAELEEAERIRLEEEAQRLALEAELSQTEAEQLREAQSEFFGQLRRVLGGREGIEVRGDRFVFSSEVLFSVGSANLAPAGQDQIAEVAGILQDISDEIPEGVDWILRVDGHTDNIPIAGGVFADNWELSQARALSVVRFMVDQLGFPPERLAATGFGEYRPVNPADTAQARAQNRRIELKLTER
ncbi:MAG: peptidoglycan -binding protein [Pseudomonadota bacterium]